MYIHKMFNEEEGEEMILRMVRRKSNAYGKRAFGYVISLL